MNLGFYTKVIALLFFSQLNFAQPIVINELDCDTPGIDNAEFLELKSAVPNFPLDGYVVVFFNGSANGGNTSYFTTDLDGYVTDVNGIFLIGSVTVSPFPQYIIPENTIQNGADGVAIYKANAEDFIEGTVAYVDDSLVDVLIYGTADPDAVSMLDIFRSFNPNIKQINEGNGNNVNSIQRNNDGSYISGPPTPRKLNDGSGINIIGVRATFDKSSYTEGDKFKLSFTTESVHSADLNISINLNNGGFKDNDYLGNKDIKLVAGTTEVSTEFSLVDDSADEGDEEMILRVMNLPSNFLALNNNVRIRVVDNDYSVANFGTPLSPTYGKVKGTQSRDYYDKILGQKDSELKNKLQSIIADPNIVRAQTYNDVIDILKEADQNPANSNQVWLVYLEKGRSKLDLQLNADNFNTWNREHTWPRSRAGYNSIEADETFNGKDIFWVTGPDSLRHGNSDAHAIRAVDGPENSSRGNQFYGQYSGPSANKGSFKGDVARGIFYLAVRYNGLDVVRGYPEGLVGKFGDLDTLLAWHRNDPPDDFEMNRNNVVFSWQYNRNPFIDAPDLVEYIWGRNQGQTWNGSSNVHHVITANINISPNPSSGIIKIDLGSELNGKISVVDDNGVVVLEKYITETKFLELALPPIKGHYFVIIQKDDGIIFTKKVSRL